MKVTSMPDHPVDDASCKAATGKSFAEWFAFLDSVDGIKIGRRASMMEMWKPGTDNWWPTTIYVEYEKHHGVVKKDGLAEGYSICATKTISAPIPKVYQVWTDPNGFKEMFGDNGRQDPKEGGAISCDAGCKGTFTRVRPDKDLRFTWEHPGCTAPMLVDVMFQDNKGKTLMNVMTARIQTRAESDGLRDAWGEALSRLKALAEA
jgi:uncharacterized protein YndB with AHSA1/START domain